MFRLLAVLLVVAMLAFTVRVGEVVSGLRDLSGGVNAAEDKKDAAKEPVTPKEQASTQKELEGAPPAGEEKKEKSTEATSEQKGQSDDKRKSWPDAADMDPELANVREGLVKDLAERRKQLDAREKDLTTREAVLKATESEIDQKFRELNEVRKQLQSLLGQQSEEETARIKSLVRIYEGMKPADAARIFNTLDTKILLDVLTRMSERKTAPVLAAMDPDRARTVTLLMAQQRALPDLPELADPDATGAP